MNIKAANIEPIISPKSVAVIGASDNPTKVGHAIMQNYIDVDFQGKIYPINISAQEKIMGRKAYKSVAEVKEPIDLAVICVPAEFVPQVILECGKAKVKGVVVVSSGFAEVGNQKLQDKLEEAAKRYKLPVIGPNCLGIMDPRSKNDTLFLPTYKIERPKIGGVSFVSQSGSVGSSILDLISAEGFGLARFISYGNAAVVDEVDILNYLSHDKETRVVVFYIEGVKRGKEFAELAKKATMLKPVVILKGGTTPSGATAAHSHTASLAGSTEAYKALFRQFGFITAETLEDLLYFAKIFDTQPLTTGNRIGIITNGGGHGVLATDALYNSGLAIPELGKETQKYLRKVMPPIVNVRLPLDIGGDAGADRFSAALEALNNDSNVDAIMAITLFQTPGADEKVAETIINQGIKRTKPLVVVSTGSSYTLSHTKLIESSGVPVYESPDIAARALSALIGYSKYRKREV
ncbi:MAG TPA: CoA-binding protein [Candidatus Acidoferrum sp.]|nr:CoA-binding protein [Candidatus Acidoferrum sp.]